MLGITALSQSPIASLGGTNVNVNVTGQQLNAVLGTETIKGDANVTLTSLNLLNLTTGVETVDLNTEVNLTGLNLLNLSLGDEAGVGNANITLTGLTALSTTIGPYSIQADGNQSIVAGAEQELETDAGSVTTTADANVTLTTNLLNFAIGNEQVDVNTPVDVSGTSASTGIGSVTIDLNQEVSVTGQSLTTAINTPLVTAWSNVDPGVTNTWTDVTTVSNVWVEVDIAA